MSHFTIIALTVTLLILSNVFMTFAWYGHLNYKDKPLLIVILVSWLIAFVEYCLQVPANRIGHQFFSASQLKIIQEAITFIVFIAFSYFYLKQAPDRNELIAMIFIFTGVVLALLKPF
jgi:hypothetical protein